MRLRVLLPVLLVLCFLSAGCETAKGFGRDVENTADNIPDVWQKLQEADAWVQENMW